ncbi:TPA: hypothetical protein ACOD97_000160 [Stenotrophomonas maltophilia]
MFKASILTPTSAANAPVGSFLLADGEWNICVDLGRKALLRLTGGSQSRLLFADGNTATYLTPSVEPGFDVEIPDLQGCFKIPNGNQLGAALNYSERGMVLHGTSLPDKNEYYFTLAGKHIQVAPLGLVPLFGWSPKVINTDGTGKFYLF